MIQDGPSWNTLAVGDPVEICPYSKEHKVSYEMLGRLDGQPARLIGLADFGAERIARVEVVSKDEQKRGTWRVPVKCLKRASS